MMLLERGAVGERMLNFRERPLHVKCRGRGCCSGACRVIAGFRFTLVSRQLTPVLSDERWVPKALSDTSTHSFVKWKANLIAKKQFLASVSRSSADDALGESSLTCARVRSNSSDLSPPCANADEWLSRLWNVFTIYRFYWSFSSEQRLSLSRLSLVCLGRL